MAGIEKSENFLVVALLKQDPLWVSKHGGEDEQGLMQYFGI